MVCLGLCINQARAEEAHNQPIKPTLTPLRSFVGLVCLLWIGRAQAWGPINAGQPLAEATLQEVGAAEQAHADQRPHPCGRPPDFAQHRQAALVLATWGGGRRGA
jgi:hypothetical protein